MAPLARTLLLAAALVAVCASEEAPDPADAQPEAATTEGGEAAAAAEPIEVILNCDTNGLRVCSNSARTCLDTPPSHRQSCLTSSIRGA